MLLHPNKNWHWLFDSKIQRMTLLLGEQMQFVSELEGRKMSPAAAKAGEFTCEQTQHYLYLLEVLEGVDWPDPVKVQTALNALTLKYYHKPMMPQSWFFAQGSEMQPCQFGEMIQLQTQKSLAWFMVLEAEPTSALCMCLEKELWLSGAKSMNQFDVIKVMRDRIIEPVSVKQYARAV